MEFTEEQRILVHFRLSCRNKNDRFPALSKPINVLRSSKPLDELKAESKGTATSHKYLSKPSLIPERHHETGSATLKEPSKHWSQNGGDLAT